MKEKEGDLKLKITCWEYKRSKMVGTNKFQRVSVWYRSQNTSFLETKKGNQNKAENLYA